MSRNRFLRTALLSVTCLSVLLLGHGFAEARPWAPVQDGFVGSADDVLEYAPDRVLVRLSPDAARAVTTALGRTSGGEMALSGRPGLDRMLREQRVQSLRRAYTPQRADLARQLGIDRWMVMETDGSLDPRDVARELSLSSDVERVTVDWRAYPAAVPNDPIYPDQWGHNNTAQMLSYDWNTFSHENGSPVGTVGFDANAEAAWDGVQGFGSGSVVVAILDSGVDVDHPDLNLVAGYDFGDNDSNPDDDSASPGHGTACAGIAAAIANNGLGVAGVAGASAVMPLKVADSQGSLYFSYIQNALYHAADNGADVVSMSFGAAISSDAATDAALEYAYAAGCVLLAATGNENDNAISYPANHADVIGVGAASPCGGRKRSSSNTGELNPGVSPDPNGYTCDGERWWGSNYGSTTADARDAVDVIAPTILPTTDIGGSGGYASGDYDLWFNGTSAATPYAAGVAALVIAANPGFSNADVRDALTSTAQDVVNVESNSRWDRYSGYGMVDAAAAVGGGTPVAPTADFTADTTSGEASLTVNFSDTSSGAPTSWSWDFGDGGTSIAQNPSYTYTTAGTYTVSLTATNDVGSDTATKVDFVTVLEPGTGAPVYANGDLPVSGSVSGTYVATQASDDNRQTLQETENGGRPTNRTSYLEHKWTFDVPASASLTFYVEASREDNSDGDDFVLSYSTNNSTFTDLLTVASSSEQVYSATIPSSVSGTVYIRAIDTDRSQGNRSQDRLFVDHMYIQASSGAVPPVADFSGAPTSGDASLTVSFTDASTGAPTSWAWDFGDGNTSTSQNPSHTYSVAGTYSVSLSATNAYGSDTETKVDYITVTQPSNDPPVAAFTGDPTSGTYPLEVSFTDQSTNEPTSWSWDFGDGNTATSQSPSHTYQVAGTYTVSLTATNAYGSDTETKVDYVTVDEPTVATDMYVQDIVVTRISANRGQKRGQAVVTIVDENAQPVANAAVTGDFSGVITEFGASATTNGSGQATITTAGTAQGGGGDVCFVVTDVTEASLTYNAVLNAVTESCEKAGDLSGSQLQLTNTVPVPHTVTLAQNQPNPFNPKTEISFSLPEARAYTLTIYDVSGRVVRTFSGAEQGWVRLSWDGRDARGATVSSGAYFYRLQAGDFAETKRMILLK